MKYTVSILIVVALFTSCRSTLVTINSFNQEDDFKNDYDRELLKGNVQTYAIYNNVTTQNGNTDQKQLNVEFNDKGFITRFESYNEDGSLNIRIENIYTNDTILTETRRYLKNNQHVTIEYTTDTIKNDNKIIGWIKKQYSVMNNGYNTEQIEILDENHDLSKSIMIQQGDTLHTTLHSMQYDENNRLIKSISTQVGGYKDGYSTTISYKYDKNGNVTEVICTPETRFSRVVYQYNKKNRMKLMTTYSIKPSYYMGAIIDNPSIPQEHIITETYFDSFLNPKKVITYTNDKLFVKAQKTKYKYDKTGNWVRQKVYEKNKDDKRWNYIYQLTREISYFNQD